MTSTKHLEHELKEHEMKDEKEHALLKHKIEDNSDRHPKYQFEHDKAEHKRHHGEKHSHDPYYAHHQKN